MPKCAGCSGFTLNHDNSNCVTLTGAGTAGSHLVASLVADPTTANCLNCGVNGVRLVIDNVTPNNALSCGPDGLFASGGGGGSCSQKLYYTVATVGIVPTPQPFRSCADFLAGAGNADVAIQAAIDFSRAAAAFAPAPVFLNTGLYILAASVDTKGVRLIGASKLGTIIGNAATLGGAGGVRLIDNTVSTAPIDIEQVTLQPAGASAVCNVSLQSVSVRMVDVNLQAFGDSGAEGGFVNINQGGDVFINRCEFLVVTLSGVHDAIKIVNGVLPAPMISENYFFGAGILLDTVSYAHVTDNVITGVYTGGGVGEPTYALGLFGDSRFNTISNNTLAVLQHEGIVLDSGAGRILQNQITGNFINLYAFSGSVTEDGIRLVGNADENQIQHNAVRALGAGGRHGINISAGTCNDNFVTNNDLFNSGAGTSINDAGTATVLAAGNRL